MSHTVNRPCSNLAVKSALLVLFTALAAAVLTISAPPATAQETPEAPEFAHLDYRESCTSDQHEFQAAMTVRIPGRAEQQYAVCGPIGFRAVRTEALCDVHGGTSGWIEHAKVCATSYWFGHVVDRSSCRAPHVWLEDYQITRGHDAADYCAVPILSNASAGPASFQPVTPACIEDPIVQDDEAAAALRVGDTFISSADGASYRIMIGGPTCSFGCHDGFDMNCDGRLGDYCPVEVDFRSVRGVVLCMTEPEVS